jgi:enamine deaminase RidA (YjgF/YER057c/UK114 family)
MTDTTRQRVNISSGTLWEERVGYSRAVRIGNLVYTSGTTAMKEGALVGINDPYAQTVQILANIRWALGETGATMADVVRYRVYLVDIHDWTEVARALKETFGTVRPCSTLLAVAALIDPVMRVEIEVDAVVSPA